jgi:hypothetical protein
VTTSKQYVLYFFFRVQHFHNKATHVFCILCSTQLVVLSLSFSLADAIANTCTVVHVHSVEQMSMTWFVCYFVYEAAILPLP